MKIRRRKLEVMAPAVAMADIAFNLVLFFLILARTQDESHIKWEAARVPSVQTLPQSNVSVVIEKIKGNKDRAELYLNGIEMGDIKTLGSSLEKMLADKQPGQRTVLLKVHKDTPAATFEKVIEAISQAGGELTHVLEKDKDQ